ncbi:GyrI-like domain-containing protein [Methanobrevibacter sp. OttesenSCG-928-I08]|nr:GyrI-like domain-containing protein [Methanobrevibacter sp. OttesenSCG-928-I08]
MINEIIVESQKVLLRPYSNPQIDMEEIISELLNYIEENNLTSKNPLFGRNYLNDDNQMIFEFGIDILEDIETEYPFVSLEIPKQKVLSIIHKGPFDNISDSINKLELFIDENGLELMDIPRYIYHDKPEITKERDLITEIQFPIEII